MRWPAAIPALALSAGAAAGILISAASLTPHPLVSLAFLAAAAAAYLRRCERATLCFLLCGFCHAGFVLGHTADSATRHTSLRAIFDRHLANGEHHLFATVEGQLRRDATLGVSTVMLDLDIYRITVGGSEHATRGGALIAVGGAPSSDQVHQWRSGRWMAVPVTLRLPAEYRNPGVADAVRALERRGSSLVGSVKSAHLVEIKAAGDLLAEAASAGRAGIRRAIVSTIAPWSGRSAAVVTAILIGDRAGLDASVERKLQEAGTYHVIAISGGNIAILAGLCVIVLRLARARPAALSALTVVLLTMYGGLVEGGASVTRAILMAAIYFAVQAWDHRSEGMNLAFLAAAIIICVDPLQLTDVGLWLTFGATIAILAGTAHFTKDLPLSRWLRAPLTLVAASACVEVALFPLSAYMFARVTAAGLLVNIAAVPLMTVVQIAGMGATALSRIAPDVARGIGSIAHIGVEGLVGSAAAVDWLPWLTRRTPPPTFWLLCCYYGALLVTILAARPPERQVLRAITVAVTVCSGLYIVFAPVFSLGGATPLLRVTFLDVGQGDAALVQFPNGRTLSVDAGGLASGSFDITGRVLSPAFWALGARRLDYMTITHGDVDHIGGAVNLFRDFAPREVWEGVPVPPHRPTRDLRDLVAHAGTVWRTVQPGERVTFDQVELIVHHPPRPDWERQRVRNDDSQVIEVRYHDVSFVFTGDIGRDVEARIAGSFAPAAIRVLKAPHHGSATSSSQPFIDALDPDIVVISAGRGNPFGHPAPRVVQRYREAAAAMYRTDQDGSVTVETDGRVVRVKTFSGRRLTVSTRHLQGH